MAQVDKVSDQMIRDSNHEHDGNNDNAIIRNSETNIFSLLPCPYTKTVDWGSIMKAVQVRFEAEAGPVAAASSRASPLPPTAAAPPSTLRDAAISKRFNHEIASPPLYDFALFVCSSEISYGSIS
ncbi:hypothetical protein ACJJTC_003224 [Scirpophaga incertulas]